MVATAGSTVTNKNTITGFLYNWIGDPYRTEPHIRNWRNRHFWDKYNEEQLNAVSSLCNELCDKHNIPKQTVPSQGYLENALRILPHALDGRGIYLLPHRHLPAAGWEKAYPFGSRRFPGVIERTMK